MIRIGPELSVYQGTDRWSRDVLEWYTTDYGWMDEDRWAKVQDYQTMPKGDGIRYETMEAAMVGPLGREIKRKLDLAGCRTIWEMNLIAHDDKHAPQKFGGGEYYPKVGTILRQIYDLHYPDGPPPESLPPPEWEYVRHFAAFGEARLVEWTLEDVYVRLPQAQAAAWANTSAGKDLGIWP